MHMILLTLAAAMAAAPVLAADPVSLTATLAGSADTDPDGTGAATVTVDTTKNEVCYKLRGSKPAQGRGI